jgi:hypothetical protein
MYNWENWDNDEGTHTLHRGSGGDQGNFKRVKSSLLNGFSGSLPRRRRVAIASLHSVSFLGVASGQQG